MAEGYSHNPNQEASDDEVVKKRPESGDRFRNFIGELFKPKTDKEKKPEVESDDDDDDESTEKKKNTSESTTKAGRFTRAWRSLFPKLASKEELPADNKGVESTYSPRGLFFESDAVDAEPSEVAEQEQATIHSEASLPQYEHAGEQTDTNMRTVEAASAPVDIEVPLANIDQVKESSEPTESVELNPAASEPSRVEAPSESAQILPEAVVAEHMQRQTQAAETNMRDQAAERTAEGPERVTGPAAATATERVVVNGLTNADRLRLRKMERREKDIERDTKHIKKDLDKRPSSPAFVRPRPEAAPSVNYTERVVPRGAEAVTLRNPEKQTIREVQKEIINNKIELNPQAEQQRTPEQLAAKEQFSEAQKERIIESVLDKVDNKEVDSHKEISYELSHETKDMDKQSAAAWTAMQADADAQAKANAAAITAAQAAVGDQADSLKQIAKSQSAAMYQQAALGGFVAAVVIIAIILTILLLK